MDYKKCPNVRPDYFVNIQLTVPQCRDRAVKTAEVMMKIKVILRLNWSLIIYMN